MEIIIHECDDYATTVAKASTALGARPGSFFLISSNGCKVLEQPFPNKDGGPLLPWTIGRYVKESSRGRTQMKLGLVVDEVS